MLFSSSLPTESAFLVVSVSKKHPAVDLTTPTSCALVVVPKIICRRAMAMPLPALNSKSIVAIAVAQSSRALGRELRACPLDSLDSDAPTHPANKSSH